MGGHDGEVISNGYVPPELLSCRDSDSAQYGGEVDIWSLGVVAFEVAALQRFLPTSAPESHLQSIAQRMGPAGSRRGRMCPSSSAGPVSSHPLWERRYLCKKDPANGGALIEPTPYCHRSRDGGE